MKVINGDQAAKESAEINKNNKQNKFIENYGNNRNKTKDQFASKADYKSYKQERKELRDSEKAFNRANNTYQATEKRINDAKETTPATFIAWDNLKYKDSNGNEQNLDVVVRTSNSMPNDSNGKIENGANVGIADKGSGQIYSADKVNNQWNVYIQPGAPGNALSHEMGHFTDLISDGKGQLRDWNGANGILDIQQQMRTKPDCRTNSNHPRVAPARAEEDHFDNMH
jgi:cation transport regulator ChaB